MAQVLRVSKEGVDVLGTANDTTDYIFDSTYNTFKILDSGTVGGTVNSGTTTFTVAHGQGAAPGFYAFALFPDGYSSLPNQKPRNEGDPVQRYWFAEVDSTNLYFDFFKGTSGNYSATVSYYIFETPL